MSSPMDPHPPPAGSLKRLTIAVGSLAANCHLIARVSADSSTDIPCVMIDPGDEPDRLAAIMERHGWRPESILLTHAHFDHVGAVDALRNRYPGLRLWASRETSRRLGDPRLNLSALTEAAWRVDAADEFVEDGVAFTASDITFEPMEIPGHDPGEMVYGLREAGWLFTGDVLFAGGIGRSDFPGGDGAALVSGINVLLDGWPDDTEVYPGHGPSTTVGIEKKNNPFLR